MSQYSLVFADSIQGLVEEVNKSIADGWIVQGGVCVTILPATSVREESRLFFQAMVR